MCLEVYDVICAIECILGSNHGFGFLGTIGNVNWACLVLFVHINFFCCTTAWILEINMTHDLKLVFVSRDFDGFSG